MRRYFFFALVLFVSVLPLAAHAAFGQIVPAACDCPGRAPGYGCVLQVIQNVIRDAIALGFALATLALAYAGFTWMTSGGSAERRSQGKTLLLNVAVGIAVMLSAWLVVDFVMKTLYNGQNGGFGPWNDILAGKAEDGSDAQCLSQTTQTAITEGTVDVQVNSAGYTTEGPPGSGSCTPIPDSQLVAIDGSGHKLIPEAAARFQQMKAAAAKDGVTLAVSSAYRSPDQQLQAWNTNGCSLVSGRTVCKTRTAAVPCSLGGGGSNHTRGTAVDIQLSGGVYAWLKQHGSTYGFRNALPNDLPHWSDTGH